MTSKIGLCGPRFALRAPCGLAAPEEPCSPLEEAPCQPGDRQHHAEEGVGDVEPLHDERVRNGQPGDVEVLDPVISRHDPECPTVSRRAQQPRLPRRRELDSRTGPTPGNQASRRSSTATFVDEPGGPL